MAEVSAPAMDLRAEMIEMIGGCWSTQVCGTAARLGVPQVLATGQKAAAAVAAAANCPEEPMRRLQVSEPRENEMHSGSPSCSKNS